jgi:UPF0755 protein
MPVPPQSRPQTPPSPSPGPRPSRRRRVLLFAVLILVFLAATLTLAARAWFARWSATPFGAPDATTRLTIAPGTPSRAIAADLAGRGLVSDDRRLLIWLKLTGKLGKLQAGDYRIDTPIAPADLVVVLQSGSFERTLTIPEGWTSRQIANRLVAQGWIANQQIWLDLVARPLPTDAMDGLLDAPIQTGAEGFCFPDTYRLDAGTPPDAILDRMLDEFARQWRIARSETDRATRSANRTPSSRDLTVREVVTLASMVEREARALDEMPRIAAVYLNRLDRRMKLQCCATVYRALGGGAAWDRPLTYADLKTDSPYNTYLHHGLPPGPIANPGRAAIEAVLRPADTDDLFYVYAGDNRHLFSRTYKEHQSAVRSVRKHNPQAAVVQQDAN